MAAGDYQRFVYGKSIKHNLQPVPSFNPTGFPMDAPAGTSMVTAENAVTYTSTAYSAGDLLFYSDGATVWDSDDNVMSGSTIGSLGGDPEGAQSVVIVKPPDDLNTGSPGKYFWIFSNAGASGIRLSVVDMTGNSGKGTVNDNYAQLNGTGDGVCNRMAAYCIVADEVYATVGLIAHQRLGQNWLVWNISALTASGATGGPLESTVPVATAIGPTFSGKCSEWNSTVKINSDCSKIATMYQATNGTALVPVNIATMYIFELEAFGTTGLVQTMTSSPISIHDHGYVNPSSTTIAGRIKAYDLEWSRTGTTAGDYIYVPNYALTPTPHIDINWYDISATNVIGGVSFGSVTTPVYDNSPSVNRQIYGMVRDPYNDRIIISTARCTGNTGGYCLEYPEVVGWDEVDYLDFVDDPAGIAPVWNTNLGGVGLPGPSAVRKGMPNIQFCGIGADSSQDYWVTDCGATDRFVLDDLGILWEERAGIGLDMFMVANFAVLAPTADLQAIAVDQWSGLIYILWKIAGPVWKIATYNTDQDTYGSTTTVTLGASVGALIGMAEHGDTTVSDMTQTCADLYLLAESVDAPGQFGVVRLNKPNMTTDAMPTGAGLFASGDPPVGFAVIYTGGTNYVAYTCVLKRVWKYISSTNTWAVLANTNAGLPNNINSLHYDWDTGKLHAYVDATASTTNRYEVNQTTGELTVGTGLVTQPGNFSWNNTVKDSTYRTWHAWDYPMLVTAADIPSIVALCDPSNNTNIWKWADANHVVGCFKCTPDPDIEHTYAQGCIPLQVRTPFYERCDECWSVNDPALECMLEVTCCSLSQDAGPVEGIFADSDISLTPGGVYLDTTVNKCVTIIDSKTEPYALHLRLLNSGKVYGIDPTAGTCLDVTPNLTSGLAMDLAFDKQGNLLLTNAPNTLGWASGWTSYPTDYDEITTFFQAPACLDVNLANQIVSGQTIANVSTVEVTSIALDGTLTAVSTLTNSSVYIGTDLAVDPLTGHYWAPGNGDPVTHPVYDADLLLFDAAALTHTVIADLTTTLSLGTVGNGDFISGIETFTDATGLIVRLYILVTEHTFQVGEYKIKLYETNTSGGLIGGPVYLINPVSSNFIWTEQPVGLAYRDICRHWSPTVHSFTPYSDCPTCLAVSGVDDCCYKLTECTTGAVIYVQDNALAPYAASNQVVQNAALECYTVETSIVCVSPVAFTVVGAPFSDCVLCQVIPPVCYKLVKCGDPSDVVYTNDTLTPTINAYLGATVWLTTEYFCREVSLDPPCGAPAVSVTATMQAAMGCSYCHFHIELQNCVDPTQYMYADYATSATLIPYVGTGQAVTVTIGGVPYGTLPDSCFQVTQILGPNFNIAPNLTVAVASFGANCTACYGTTCWELEHCCGTSYVGNVIVSNTSGVVVGDVHATQRIQADVTIAATLYSGCWKVTAAANCTGVIPDTDITVQESSTIGSGMVPDCASCAVIPCPSACVLLERCDDPAQQITVSGADGVLVGTDAVELQGYSGCWRVCDTTNAIHGIQWFYGTNLGIDFRGGAPTPNLLGASNMDQFDSGPSNYATTATAIHCVQEDVTLGSTAYLAGDLMFYSDGRFIYNRDHIPMLDQTGNPTILLGGGSTTPGWLNQTYAKQSALVIPNEAGGKTGNVWHQYYLVYNTILDGPIYTCIIDMTLNAGSGYVITASQNTVLHASSGETMCVTASMDPSGASNVWYLYDRPIMATSTDYTNNHIRGVKFSSAGIDMASCAVACDMQAGQWSHNDQGEWSSGELLVDPTNRILALRCKNNGGSNPFNMAGYTLGVYLFSINHIDGKMTGPGGTQMTNGYNGGANNGAYSFLGMLGIGMTSSSFGDWISAIAFTQSGQYIYLTYETFDSHQIKLRRINCGELYYNQTTCNTINCTGNNTNILSGYPDANNYNGCAIGNWWTADNLGVCNSTWVPTQGGPSGNMAMGSLKLAPDGRIWTAMNCEPGATGFEGRIGGNWGVAGNPPGTDTIQIINGPDDSPGTIDAQFQMGPAYGTPGIYSVGNQIMGTGFPTWLPSPCPCDPANIVPITIIQPYVDCTVPECSTTLTDGWKIEECECSGASSCDTTTPYNSSQKTWEPTCNGSGTPQRWTDIVDAVQLLATGVNQTLNFTYSTMKAGDGTLNNFPAFEIESGIGANTTRKLNGCGNSGFSYVNGNGTWLTEIGLMFTEVKNLFEAMFNTSCGYNADLTINFTHIGRETGAATDLNATMNAGVAGVFTDSNGGTNIGDFRIGMSRCSNDCGNQGNALNTVAYAMPPNNNAVVGTNRQTAINAVLIFDKNEDWRATGQAVVANSVHIVLVGIHEILHSFGFGHNIKDYGTCASLCQCPCYSAPWLGCPNFCPGWQTNGDSLMGQFASSGDYFNLYPTGLTTGIQGIYERRAVCNIYGNPDSNYGCMDITCGCSNLVYYSTDTATLGTYLPPDNIIEWDDGTGPGARCWEVTYLNPFPSVPDLNPFIPAITNQGDDCNMCVNTPLCWNLQKCCGTGPTLITTDTDMSIICGAMPLTNIIEITAYPGACYEILCSATVPCVSPTSVTITAQHLTCVDCCITNRDCYSLTACDDPTLIYITDTNLVANLGQVITLTAAPGIPNFLDHCWQVDYCGTCTTSAGSCFSVGPITVGSVVTCPTCPQAGACYTLTDCAGLLPNITGVAPNVDLDNAFINGTTVEFPVGSGACYLVILGSAPCTTVVSPVTPWASCALCDGGPTNWACNPAGFGSLPCCVSDPAGPYSTQAACIASGVCCTPSPGTYLCDPAIGCYDPGDGSGTSYAYCDANCDPTQPRAGAGFEGDCENCLNDTTMMSLFEKIAEICEDCNPPVGLTAQELICDPACFGNSNIYFFIDMTSVGGSTPLDKLNTAAQLRLNLIEPTYNLIRNNNPSYTGKLYILLGWSHDNCSNVNGTTNPLPGSPVGNGDGERYIKWLMYPLHGNAGANAAGGTPLTGGTLPVAQRTPFKYTNVTGIGGAGANCSNYITADEKALIEQIIILPGSYTDDGFTQKNPWTDAAGLEGMSDPYHEFEGGDTNAITICFQDEVFSTNATGYYTTAGNYQSGAVNCGSATTTNWTAGVKATTPATCTAGYIEDYDQFMEVHEFGWDVSGNPNTGVNIVSAPNYRALIYATSHYGPFVNSGRQDFVYHLYGAIGQGATTVTCHIDCANYIAPPAGYNINCDVATDLNVPNPYAGSGPGGGDPALTPGYLGASLYNYGVRMAIPETDVYSISGQTLYDVLVDILSDCGR